MIERKFVEDHIKSLEIEEFLAKNLEKADYSHTDIQITPLSTRLIIYVGRPGIAIGRAGKNIELITKILSNQFNVKNPQLDIQTITNPDLDANYVAHQISSALERYVKPNRIVNIYLSKIMQAGAHGAEIQISGKISGGRGRTDKKQIGYIKKSGDFVLENVANGFSTAKMKPGVLGIKVMIMKNLPESMLIEKKIKDLLVDDAKTEKKKDAKTDEIKTEEVTDSKDDDSKKVVDTKKDDKAPIVKEDKKVVAKKEVKTKKVSKMAEDDTKKDTDKSKPVKKKEVKAETKDKSSKTESLDTKKTDKVKKAPTKK